MTRKQQQGWRRWAFSSGSGRAILVAAGVWAWGWAGAGEAGPREVSAGERYEYNEPKMGSYFKLIFYAPDKNTADQAAAAAYQRIDELNMIFSDYEAKSELSQLSQASPTSEPVKLSDPLWIVLSRAQKLSDTSEGAFDITVGPYVRLWRRARKTHELPKPEALAKAAQAVGYRHLHLDEKAHTAALDQAGMILDLGGIAMGYTVDEVLKLLAQRGIKQALVDGSGDIGLGDPPPDKPGWTIGIAPSSADGPSERYVTLANCAITTSGDIFQHVVIGGRRYSHIVDPKTGLGLTDRSSVTLVARDCTTADSVTKAIAVLGPSKGMELVGKLPGAEVLIRRVVDEQVETYESPGLKALESEE